MKEASSEGNIVKDFLYHHGRSKIRDQLEKYIKDLKEGNSTQPFMYNDESTKRQLNETKQNLCVF